MGLRGRPRKFDRQTALVQMLHQFREKGYEGATLADLIGAAGIAPPSFYAAFESKLAVFCEAVDLYMDTTGKPVMQALNQGGTLRQDLAGMLQQSINVALSCESGGCLLIVGVLNCSPENRPARDYLQSARNATRQGIADRLEQARQHGEIRTECNIEQPADFFHGVLQMISLQARDGATREQLESLIPPALQGLVIYQ